MQVEKLTIKAREALQEAHTLAEKAGHPEVRPLHLLVVLCDQQGGIVDLRDFAIFAENWLE